MLKITGLEEFQRKIEQLQRNAAQIHGDQQVRLVDLFPPAFMRQHSVVPDFASFCRDGGLDTSSQEALNATPAERMDAVTRQLTTFPTWQAMKQAGAADWAKRRLSAGMDR